ncbi:hypothetical protein BX600DRAFT_449234, partial [Xylariales sp. PMI_506]
MSRETPTFSHKLHGYLPATHPNNEIRYRTSSVNPVPLVCFSSCPRASFSTVGVVGCSRPWSINTVIHIHGYCFGNFCARQGS